MKKFFFCLCVVVLSIGIMYPVSAAPPKVSWPHCSIEKRSIEQSSPSFELSQVILETDNPENISSAPPYGVKVEMPAMPATIDKLPQTITVSSMYPRFTATTLLPETVPLPNAKNSIASKNCPLVQKE